MGARQLFLRLLLGEARGKQVYSAWRARRIAKLPDRQVMLNHYIPAFAADGGTILWVGCQEYTAGYPSLLEAAGGRVWTTDIDAEAAQWGHGQRHRTGDIRDADRLFADVTFDAILINGVLGFGVNAPEDQRRTIEALARIIRPGGRMLLGWNRNKIADPIAAGVAAPWFRAVTYAGLEPRITFSETTHVYDMLVRNDHGNP